MLVSRAFRQCCTSTEPKRSGKLIANTLSYRNVTQIEVLMNESVSVTFPQLGASIPDIVDLRNLEAPEPMEKVLMACAQLGTDEFFLAHLPHVPNLLFPHLESRGLQWWIHEKADQGTLLLIRRTD